MSLMEMSIMAGALIIVIIIIRLLFLNHLPKITFPILWGVVLIRLLLPFSFYTSLSLNVFSLPLFVNDSSLDSTMPNYPNHTEENIVGGNQSVNEQRVIPTTTSTYNLRSPEAVNVVANNSNQINWLIVIWISGIVLSTTFFAFGYWRAHQLLGTAILLETDFLNKWKAEQKLVRSLSILTSDQVTTPLTLGILKPKIILPATMDMQNSTNFHYILAHEFYHIKRVDALWKLLAVVVVCVHWFNPFVWAAFILANRDLEISCDEWVIRKFKRNTKKEYANALISMAEYQSGFTPLYNHFARQAIKERIETIMKTKKTTVIGIMAAVAIISLLTFTAFSASAEDLQDLSQGSSDSLQDSSQEASESSQGSPQEASELLQNSSQEGGDYVQDAEGFTVVDHTYEYFEDYLVAIDDALDIEEIGQIGADYILDVLGESIDGLYILLSYWYLPERGEYQKHYWSGAVMATRDEVDNYINGENITPLFSFGIDAITGERMRVDDHRMADDWNEFLNQLSDFDCFDYAISEDLSDQESMSEWEMWDIMTDEELAVFGECLVEQEEAVVAYLLEAFPSPSQMEIDEAMEIAKDYAERHFNDSSVISIAATPREYYPVNELIFEAEDETGSVVQINLERDTNRFIYVVTLLR